VADKPDAAGERRNKLCIKSPCKLPSVIISFSKQQLEVDSDANLGRVESTVDGYNVVIFSVLKICNYGFATSTCNFLEPQVR
jgi:hypothetical protein